MPLISSSVYVSIIILHYYSLVAFLDITVTKSEKKYSHPSWPHIDKILPLASCFV